MDLLFSVDSRHHGKGSVVFAWHPEGSFIASTGNSRVVHVFDELGNLIDKIVPPSASICMTLEWNPNGEILAITQVNSPVVVLWELRSKAVREIDTNAKEITFIKWSKSGSLLGLGTARGAMIILDHTTGQRTVATAKHKKRISCGDWNSKGDIAFASDDKQITICNSDGKTLDQVKVKYRPVDIAFGGRQEQEESVVLVNMDGKTLLLYNLKDRSNAIELAFQDRYGSIVDFHWFGDGCLAVGFSLGFVVKVSTHPNEIGQELFCSHFHPTGMRALAPAPPPPPELKQQQQQPPSCAVLATCGENCVKLVDMGSWKELSTHVLGKPPSSSSSSSSSSIVERVAWSSDGESVSFSSRAGCLFNFKLRPTPPPGSSSESSGGESGASHAAFVLLFEHIDSSSFFVLSIAVVATVMAAIMVWFDRPAHDVIVAMLGINPVI